MKIAASALIAVAAMMLGSCAKTRPPLTVPQVIAQIDALNGQTIRVQGFLGMCEGYECHMFVDRQSAGSLSKALATTPSKTPPPEPRGPILNIGNGAKGDFDAKAAPFVDSFVVITGKVTNRCRYKGESACTERSPDIEPTDIVSLKEK